MGQMERKLWGKRRIFEILNVLRFSGIHGLIPCIASGVREIEHSMEYMSSGGSSALYLC
jgi:hypothetical protein